MPQVFPSLPNTPAVRGIDGNAQTDVLPLSPRESYPLYDPISSAWGMHGLASSAGNTHSVYCEDEGPSVEW